LAPQQQPEALPPLDVLRQALQDKNFNALDGALRAIPRGSRDTTAAIAVIERVLTADDPAIRRLAAYALSELDPEAARQRLPALCAGLRDRGPRVRARVAFALGNIGPAAKEAGPLLLDLLSDDDGRVRAGAARALGLIGAEAPAVGKLTDLLKDPEP